MARLQFKVTFTNAQPGAPVEILSPSTEHVYPSAASSTAVGGKQLYLDATNSVTVWSDAQTVTAQTVDGAGSYIQGTATTGSATITVTDGTAPTNPAGSAASLTLADRGNWATTTAYAVGDVVTQSNNRYICETAHTSGTFATDLTAAKWVLTGVASAAGAAENVNTVTTSGATQTIPDVTTATLNQITLTANCAFTFPTAAAGKSFTIVLTQDATGSRGATWPGTVKWPNAVAPVLTTTAAKSDVVTFTCSDGTNWLGFFAGANF